MKRVFLALVLSVLTLCGYDEFLLEAQMSVIPKIAVLDKEISKKLIDDKLVIAIAHETEDTERARMIAADMNAKTQGKTGPYAFRAVAVDFYNIPKTQMSFLYILKGSDQNIKKATAAAKAKGVVSFTHRRSDIDNGAVLSMDIERKTVIILNRNSMKDGGIRFVDSFYKIVRVVD